MPAKNSSQLENNQVNSSYGGARKNAGRKPGAATTKTREIANKAIEEGVSPLEYMLGIMRAPEIETEDPKLMMDQWAMRFEAAKAAAPYVHPRLAAVEMNHGTQEGDPIAAMFLAITERAKLVPSGAGRSKA